MLSKQYQISVDDAGLVSCLVVWPGTVPGDQHSVDLKTASASCLHRFHDSFGVGSTPGGKQLADCILHDFLFEQWSGNAIFVDEFRRDFLHLSRDQKAVQIDGVLIARWLSERGFDENLWLSSPAANLETQPVADPETQPGAQPNMEG